MAQYVSVRFGGSKRTYTYVNNGAPVTVGDRVKVADRSGDGWNPVEVVAIVGRPDFECKPILGRVEGADVDERILAAPTPPPPPADLFGGL